MSQFTGRDGSTSHTPYVSPTTSSNTSLRNNPPASTSAVLTNTLIPRDYLASLSTSRLNATKSSSPNPQSPLSQASSSGVSSHATARAIVEDESSDDDDYEDLVVDEEPEEIPPKEDLKREKTRTDVHAPSQTQALPNLPLCLALLDLPLLRHSSTV